MFGILVDEPAYVYGDNQLVLENKTMPQYTLKNNYQSIDYQFICKCYAADEWRTTYINTLLNVVDLMTKQLSGNKRWGFVRMLLHHM